MAFIDGTSLLANFNASDGALDSNWTTDALNDGAAAPRIVSNQFAAASGGGYSSARWNAGTWSGYKKAYVSIPALPELSRYMSLGFVKNPGTDSVGYIVEYRVGTGVRLFRVNDTGLDITVLGSAVAWSPSAGDALGIGINEPTGQIEAWVYSGGSWSLLFDEADSTHTGDMYPFIYLRGNNTRGDDFYVGSDAAPVSVSPGPATAVAAAVNPTVVLGSVSVSPAAASVVAASVAPTVVAGSISFTPSVVTITTASVAPTVVTGPVSVTPAAATAVAASVAPAVVQSSQTVAPAAATVVAASVAPTTVAGSLSLAPSPATAVIATVAPSVVAGSVSVAPAASTVVVASVAPTVQTGGIDVAPAAASAVIASVAPSVVLGSQSVAPAAASAVIATVAPTVSAGGNLTLAPDPVTVVAASVAPSVVAGPISVTPAAVSAVTSSVDPAIAIGGEMVTPAAAWCLVSIGQPQVIATVGQAIAHPGRTGAGVRGGRRAGVRVGGRTRVR